MAKPITIYKTAILYLLEHSVCPLSNLQISDFFLQAQYTDYFQVQEVLAELVDFQLIAEHRTHENTQYTITEKGRDSLSFLGDKLNYEFRQDIKTFFDKNQLQFQMENSVYSDYRKVDTDAYSVDLVIQEEKRNLLSVSMIVHSKEQAEQICDVWKNTSDEVYASLLATLLNGAK